MLVKKLMLRDNGFPGILRHIADPPKQLFVLGASLETLLQQPCLTVVGSRKVSAYGKTVTTQLVRETAGSDVTIISGLAIGVDGIAHRAAFEANAQTIAVLPCGLDRIYPHSHRQLAERILQSGGALVSEYPPGSTIYPLNFIARNRIAAGLSQGVLITEAAEKSGSLHTAHFALEQGREVMAVPGNITSPTSAGTNNLIKSGATPVTKAADILQVLGIAPKTKAKTAHGATAAEQRLLELLQTGISDARLLFEASQLDASLFNQTLTMLEITGKIRPLGNNHWSL